MTTMSNAHALPELLAAGGWARRLAARLVDESEAEDLVHDAWTEVGAHAVTGTGTTGAGRAWLGGVMRNLARMRRRAGARRRVRDAAGGSLVHGERVARPDELAERLETQRRLAGLVLGLPALYRDVVLLRFYDDLATDAESYLGKTVTLRAEVKAADVSGWAGLFLRVEGDDGRVLRWDRRRVLPADRDWHSLEVAVAIPSDAQAFSYGFLLSGRGHLEVRKVALTAAATP